MKVYVYFNPVTDTTTCYSDELTRHTGIHLIQIIEAEETTLPITENWKGNGVEVGEVFVCNDDNENLIRTA
jgi:hypothetical protein